MICNISSETCGHQHTKISSFLSPLTLTDVGASQMTLQQYLSTFPCLLLLSGNLQTPFLSILWCYLSISSSVFPIFLLLSLSPAESSSPCQRILRRGHIIWVSVSSPWLGDHRVLQLHSPRSSPGLTCIKEGGWYERPHQKNLRSKRDVLVPQYDLQYRKSCCLERISGFYPSLEMIDPSFFKVSTGSSLWPFILISLWKPFRLFVITFILSGPISIMYLVVTY